MEPRSARAVERHRRILCPMSTLLFGLALASCCRTSRAFVAPPTLLVRTGAIQPKTLLFYSNNKGEDGDGFDYQRLSDRLFQMRLDIMEEELQKPPNAKLSPTEFVSELLDGLWDNSDPLPDAGFRRLLRASTTVWRGKLYKSVGAPATADQEVVATALGEAMERPHNQFGLLVGQDGQYTAAFENEPLEYPDGTCWVECRLRGKDDNELLAVTGWQLCQRRSDGAWLVDSIDWQDFREEFRPGIGREEWDRICG